MRNAQSMHTQAESASVLARVRTPSLLARERELWREREIVRERERKREGVREKEGVSERERGSEWERKREGGREREKCRIWLILFLKGMTGALTPFSYLVIKYEPKETHYLILAWQVFNPKKVFVVVRNRCWRHFKKIFEKWILNFVKKENFPITRNCVIRIGSKTSKINILESSLLHIGPTVISS